MMTPTLEQIWDQFAEKLRQFIGKRINDPAAADDILQDVFVKIARRLDRLEEPHKLQGWIFLIARNAVIDHYRTRKQTVEITDTMEAEDTIASAEVEELSAAFRRMIDNLPEPYREAIRLTEFEGMTQQELANHLGISLSGAKSRVQRGRQQLKEMLFACCRFEFDRRGRVFDCEPHEPDKCPECGTK